MPPDGGRPLTEDHPRRRGEHTPPRFSTAESAGSSPQARGTQNRKHRSAVRSPDHPRRRGEHWRATSSTRRLIGSSPQARGTRRRSSHQYCGRRIIPAGAGNTRMRATMPPPLADHPRRRGEHVRDDAEQIARDGSSPQARGTLFLRLHHGSDIRIIPAGAGNTLPAPSSRLRYPDHPRRRGEHAARLKKTRSSCGSSPQARGTLIDRGRRGGYPRIIPAGAGNTCARGPVPQTTPDHPRRRGEHTGSAPRFSTRNGSSPQARGTRGKLATAAHGVRIIPAGAGNTQTKDDWPRQPADHPRRRGEHRFHRIQHGFHRGSSPQARGTHDGRRIGGFCVRIIPAGAGNTNW